MPKRMTRKDPIENEIDLAFSPGALLRHRASGDESGVRRSITGVRRGVQSRIDLCEADLRCLDAHAHLGNLMFDARPEDAIRHYPKAAATSWGPDGTMRLQALVEQRTTN